MFYFVGGGGGFWPVLLPTVPGAAWTLMRRKPGTASLLSQ